MDPIQKRKGHGTDLFGAVGSTGSCYRAAAYSDIEFVMLTKCRLQYNEQEEKFMIYGGVCKVFDKIQFECKW